MVQSSCVRYSQTVTLSHYLQQEGWKQFGVFTVPVVLHQSQARLYHTVFREEDKCRSIPLALQKKSMSLSVQKCA